MISLIWQLAYNHLDFGILLSILIAAWGVLMIAFFGWLIDKIKSRKEVV
jgi:hypothetical protein